MFIAGRYRARQQPGFKSAHRHGERLDAIGDWEGEEEFSAEGTVGGGGLETAGEKRSSQARNRSAFFNSLRMKSSANQSAATEPNGATSTNSVEEVISLSSNQEDSSSLSRGLSSVSVDDSREPMEFDDDLNDDEKAFLESLGWEKDAQVEVLTAEEIDAFVKEHGLVRQSSRLSHYDLGTMKTDAASSTWVTNSRYFPTCNRDDHSLHVIGKIVPCSK